jgi:hypothetical protein
VLMDEEEHLRLLVAQDWRKIVQADLALRMRIS